MKLGAEPKKIAVLGLLVVVAAVVLYTNSSSSDIPSRASSTPAPRPSPPVAASQAPPAVAATAPAGRPAPARAARTSNERGSTEFRPSLKPKRPEDRPDPTTIDPALHLELLAKLQNVRIEGGERSLFEFSQPKPPKVPDVKIQPKKTDPKTAAATAAAAEEVKPKTDPPKPPPPPILLKFYGYISPVKQGAKRAFFLDGEEIVVAAEGELIKKRYKVVRIGINSVVVEDTQHKHQQTLALEERAG